MFSIDELRTGQATRDRPGAERLITTQQMDDKGRRRVEPRGRPTIHHRRRGLARHGQPRPAGRRRRRLYASLLLRRRRTRRRTDCRGR